VLDALAVVRASDGASTMLRAPYRRLSYHVVTRWYRAPEMLLAEALYDYSTDLWSMAVIMGEIIQLQHAKTREALFAADTSRLSPTSPTAGTDKTCRERPECEQLEAIVECLGAPTEEDFPDIADAATKEYLSTLRDSPPALRDLPTRFPQWSSEEHAFMKELLIWKPGARLSAAQMLAHPFFDEVRSNEELFGNIAEVVEGSPCHSISALHAKWLGTHTNQHYTKGITSDDIEAAVDQVVKAFHDKATTCRSEGPVGYPPAHELHLTYTYAMQQSPRHASAMPTTATKTTDTKTFIPSADNLLAQIRGWQHLHDAMVEAMQAKCDAGLLTTQAERRICMVNIQCALQEHPDAAGALARLGVHVAPKANLGALQAAANVRGSINWNALHADVEASLDVRPQHKKQEVVVRSAEAVAQLEKSDDTRSTCCNVS